MSKEQETNVFDGDAEVEKEVTAEKITITFSDGTTKEVEVAEGEDAGFVLLTFSAEDLGTTFEGTLKDTTFALTAASKLFWQQFIDGME